MIRVYPKIIVYCPEKKKEIDGKLCANCEKFKGVKFSFENKGVRMFFECDSK